MTIKTEKPLDYSGQVWRGIDDKFPKKIHNATTTSDGLMSAEDKAKLDAVDINDYNRTYDVASWESDGLLSKEDKKILDGLNDYYEYIMEEELKHVTDEQIAYWNAKASTAIATQKTDGLMSSIDKTKLDGIENNANNYIHPEKHPPSIIAQNALNRFVTDEQIKYWNDKADNMVATQTTNGLLSVSDKIKLDGIEEGANRYVHPNNEGVRHVSDAEKEYWNSKADKNIVTNTEDGLMASVDKIKLDSIEEGARSYVHPNDENTRHVTDKQIKFWNEKADNTPATTSTDGLMTAEDKVIIYELYSIDPDMEDKHYVTSAEKKYWNDKVNFADLATQAFNGLMSSIDKIKLDGIEEEANNYIHPETHSATMIVEDETHKFVTDKEKEIWNSKADNTPATIDKDGLMTAEDKAKLNQLTVPESQEISLTYSKWVGDGPYTQVLTVPGITPSSNAYIGINTNATIEQMTVAAEANLKVQSVEQDKIIIIANGEKPNIDLPIIIITGSNILVFEVNNYDNKEYIENIPTTGKHYENEIIYSSVPTTTKCIGWVCTETGEPGKWVPFGSIEI